MKIRLKETFQKYSFPLGCTSLSLAGILAIAALVGDFDGRKVYCLSVTKPCTTVITPEWYQSPGEARLVKTLPGHGFLKTFLGFKASVFALLAFACFSSAVARQLKKDDDVEEQDALDGVKQQILEGEEAKKAQIASDYRLKDFEAQMEEGYAYLQIERNPEFYQQQAHEESERKRLALLEREAELVQVIAKGKKKGEVTRSEKKEEIHDELVGVILPEPPDLGTKFWNWHDLQDKADDLPHIRVIGATNGGKTTLANWMLDVVPADRSYIVTIKRKPHQWQGLEVIGVPENYPRIRRELNDLQSERVYRTRLMEQGKSYPKWNVLFDEWRAIVQEIVAIKENVREGIDAEPSAKSIMGKMITLGRETNIRIFAMAQGRQVKSWGLEDESDLEECFASFFMGKFAVEECKSKRNEFNPKSEGWAKWDKTMAYLAKLGKRALWVSTSYGSFPGIIPDLSKWARAGTTPVDVEVVEEEPKNFSGEEELQRSLTSETTDPSVLRQSAIAYLEMCGEADCPETDGDVSEEGQEERQPKPLLKEGSDENKNKWTVRKISELYPKSSPEQLYQEMKVSAKDCPKARMLIRGVLKCTQGTKHPSRSYSVHGKPLFVWLLDNYDDGTLREKYAKEIEGFRKEIEGS